MQWFLKVVKNYAGFAGRARRKEYWMFILVYFIFNIVLSIAETIFDINQVLTTLFGLALLLPTLAVTARRLHDTGRSGWMQLIGLIPIIGSIIVIVFLCKDSQSDDNRFGPNPKYSGKAAIL
ncbi:DUF805 domain-containing protein [Neobacillus pocheonensis]|uniref:DUF805 domain-containing protein n=1 Tax=Neobacillus pocheonensis TaxID=363869 RepID=UPI003D2AEA48